MNERIDVKKRVVDFLKRAYKSSAGIMIAFILIFVIMCISKPAFLTRMNMINLLKQTVTTGLLSYGLCMVLVAGEIDLSVSSMVGLAAIILMKSMKLGIGFIPALFFTLMVAALCGLLNGILVAKTPIPAFIVTLATQSVWRGAAYIYSGAIPITVRDNSTFLAFGNNTLFGIPYPVFYLLILGLVLYFIMKYTIFGRHLYATGGNRETAVYSGINVYRVQIIVFIISSMLAALCGCILSSRITQAASDMGTGYEADAIAAAVLGGTSFNGGRGSIPGALMGALVLALISNSLYLLEVNVYLQMIIKGLLIVVAV